MGLNTLKSGFSTIALLGVAAAIGVISWAGYWSLMEMFGWKDKAEQWLDDIKEEYLPVDPKTEKPIRFREVVVGRKEYFNPQTGATTENPLAGVPILGTLFGAGINIGMAGWNVVDERIQREQNEEYLEEVEGPDK